MEAFFTDLLIHLGAFTLVIITMVMLFIVVMFLEDLVDKLFSNRKQPEYNQKSIKDKY